MKYNKHFFDNILLQTCFFKRTVEFISHDEHPWGGNMNLQDTWESWKITELDDIGQFPENGIELGTCI